MATRLQWATVVRSLAVAVLALAMLSMTVPEATAGRRPKASVSGSFLGRKGARQLGAVWAVTDQGFERDVLRARGVVLVDFWAEWCHYCKRVAPIVAEAARQFAGRATVVQVNVDRSPVIASRLEISSIPTLLLFKDGALVDALVGSASLAQVQAMIARHLPSTPAASAASP